MVSQFFYADMDEFLKYQDKLVAEEDVSGYKFSGEVTQMPKPI